MQECNENKFNFTSFLSFKSIYFFFEQKFCKNFINKCMISQVFEYRLKYVDVVSDVLMISQVDRCCFRSNGCYLKSTDTSVIF